MIDDRWIWTAIGAAGLALVLLQGCAPSDTPNPERPDTIDYSEHSYLELSEYCVRGDVMDYSRLCKQFHLLHDRPE